MESALQPHTIVKSALFVDFDNIYIGLSKTDPLAAERFASDPARWLAWLEKGLPGIPPDSGGSPLRRRSILIRRCYPNPDAGFRRYRSFFTSAAFSVIDCPSLTRTGKNSSDIYMVMDILDTLNHKTYFDEFIIFSGDSDFMPVLLRLRAHDRRTTTLAIDFMPPAFKAACDLVISEEEFIEDALGVSHENGGSNGILRAPFVSARLELPVLKEMAQRVLDTVRQENEVAGAELPDILKDFREFRESSNWLGFGTSQRLAEAITNQEPRLNLVRINPVQYKLVIVEKPQAETVPTGLPTAEKPPKVTAPEPVRALLPEVTETRPAAARPETEDSQEAALRRQITAAVREVVRSSDHPVLLARASQFVVSRVGPRVLESQWCGAGSFKKLLLNLNDLGLEVTSHPEPGYIFDPRRHTHPSQRGARRPTPARESEASSADKSSPRRAYPSAAARGLEYPARVPAAFPSPSYPPETFPHDVETGELAEPLPSLTEFARRVSQVTGAPLLTSEQYAMVFQGVHAEMLKIAEGQKTYNTYQSAKAVSDWCSEQGHPIAHGDIALIFKGIIFSERFSQDGARFGNQPDSYSPLEIARVVRDNIHTLCQRSRLELSEDECCMLDTWIMGGLELDQPCEHVAESPEET